MCTRHSPSICTTFLKISSLQIVLLLPSSHRVTPSRLLRCYESRDSRPFVTCPARGAPTYVTRRTLHPARRLRTTGPADDQETKKEDVRFSTARKAPGTFSRRRAAKVFCMLRTGVTPATYFLVATIKGVPGYVRLNPIRFLSTPPLPVPGSQHRCAPVTFKFPSGLFRCITYYLTSHQNTVGVTRNFGPSGGLVNLETPQF